MSQEQNDVDLFAGFRKVTPTSIIEAVESKKENKETKEEFEPNNVEDLRKRFLEEQESEDEEEQEEIPAEVPDTKKENVTEIVADEDNLYYVFAQTLAEKGIIEEFDAEKKDLSEEDIFLTIQNQIEKGVESYKNSLSEEAKRAVEYLNTYGTLQGFQEVYQEVNYAKVDWDKVKEDEEAQEFLVAQKLLTVDGEDEQSVEETIADLKASGLLAKTASKSLEKLTKFQEDKKAFIENKRLQDEKLRQESLDKDRELLKSKIISSPDIAGFTPDKKTRENFFDFMYKKDPKTKKTAMEQVYEDKDNQIKMAWYLFNKFDFSKFEKQVAATKVSKLKEMIERENKNKGVKPGSRTRAEEANNDKDPLAAFKKLS